MRGEDRPLIKKSDNRTWGVDVRFLALAHLMTFPCNKFQVYYDVKSLTNLICLGQKFFKDDRITVGSRWGVDDLFPISFVS